MYLVENVNNRSVDCLNLETLKRITLENSDMYKLVGSTVKWSPTVFERDDALMFIRYNNDNVIIHYNNKLYILESVEYIRTMYFSDDGLIIVFMRIGVWTGETTVTIRDEDMWIGGHNADIRVLNGYTRASVKRLCALGGYLMYVLVAYNGMQYALVDLDTLRYLVVSKYDVDKSKILEWNNNVYLRDTEDMVIKWATSESILFWYRGWLYLIDNVILLDRVCYEECDDEEFLVFTCTELRTEVQLKLFFGKYVLHERPTELKLTSYGMCIKDNIKKNLVLGV